MAPLNESLAQTAQALVAPGKGILAADESHPTIKKRFDKLGIANTEENRRAYRDMLFSTPAISNHISGVILYDETIRQKHSSGTPFPKFLAQNGIIRGIKVDEGTIALANFPGEKVTEGLDGLGKRFAEYAQLGARFAKWRAVFTITDTTPSDYCIRSNAHLLARYAAIAQEAGIVPIVEPEVLRDGNHDINRCYDVIDRVLNEVFRELHDHRIQLEGILLKPSMVTAGEGAPEASVEQVAELTLRCLRNTVPPAVPGIVFLSGGQTSEAATKHLDAMNKIGEVPWRLSFSYGRALQDDPMHTWMGKPENIKAAQKAFARRAELNSLATSGKYAGE
ncbi:MAG: fructose-bisphosphate aldolase [Verrucomicrobiales bacterium]|nr:fructose-bisphosphate aldolase [Verrucomicrobiales bacterium]